MDKHTTVVDAKSGIIQVTEELVIKNFVHVMAGFKGEVRQNIFIGS